MNERPAPVRSTSTTQGKIRVLVVDDSVVMRKLISQVLGDDPELEVVATAGNGAQALEMIREVKPDLVTLDVEMPVMDGLTTLRQLRVLHPRPRIVMFSTLTTRGGSATFDALTLGADDYVAKGANGVSLEQSLIALRQELIPKIKQFFAPTPEPATVVPRPKAKPLHRVFRLLVIGTSTGGPKALSELIPALPGDLPVPVLVVQHMPPLFTQLLAERLQGESRLRVEEAAPEMRVEAGRVLIARGDHHLKVRRSADRVVAELTQEPPENFCRPAVDVLFRSAAGVYGEAVLSVMLTGMGSDGMAGTHAVKAAGGYSLAQDKASSTVWGMPGSVVQAGLADEVLPLANMAPTIIRLLRGQG